jgi:chemotaxis protein CheD
MRRICLEKTKHRFDSKANIIEIRIGESAVGYAGDILKIVSVGSCIGLVIYPKHLVESERCAIMAYIMLAQSPPKGQLINGITVSPLIKRKNDKDFGPVKIADKAVPIILNEFKKLGHSVKQLEAKMVGGAKLFSHPNGTLLIGKENVDYTKFLLDHYKIPLNNFLTGGESGMAVIFDVTTYQMIVTPVGGLPIAL